MIRNLICLVVVVAAALLAIPVVPLLLSTVNSSWLLPFGCGLFGVLAGVVFWWLWWCIERFGILPVVNVALEAVLLGTVGFLVLAFGGTLPWTWTVFNLLTAAALALWGIKVIVQKQVSWAKTPLNVLLLLLVAYFLFQLLPLPSSVLGVFQSNTVKAYQFGPPNVPAVRLAHAADGGMFPISLNRAETRAHLFMWIGYLAFFFVFINNTSKRRQVEWMLGVILLASGVTAVAGFATGRQDERLLYRQYSMSGPNDRSPILNADVPREYSAGYGFELPTVEGDKVDWYVPKVHTGDAFGGFPSSNSAATVLAMGFVLALGGLFAYVATRRSEWGKSGGLFFTREGNITLMLGFLAVLCAAALVMTKSRGALGVAAFLVPALIVWVAFSRSRMTGFITLGVIVLVLVGAGVGYMQTRGAVAPYADSFLNPFGEEVRMDARQSSWDIISDFPLFGTGLGTYGDVFPAYKVRGPDLYFAHCDVLQWAAETGLVGVILALGTLGVGVWTVIAGYRKLKDRFFKRLLIAVSVAALAFLLHGLVDFPMEIPGVMIVFVALAATAFVISRDQIARYEKEDFLY